MLAGEAETGDSESGMLGLKSGRGAFGCVTSQHWPREPQLAFSSMVGTALSREGRCGDRVSNTVLCSFPALVGAFRWDTDAFLVTVVHLNELVKKYNEHI